MFSSLPSMYSIHAADAAVLALCPFARSLQMAYCAAIGGSLSSLPVLSPLRGARQGPIGSRTGDADGGGDDDSKQWRARRDLRNRSGGSELGSEQAGRLAVAPSAAGARVADATAITETLATPLQKMAIRAESIGRPPRKREREILLTFHFPSIAASRICICSRLDGN